MYSAFMPLIFAAIFLLISGFFVARFPVKPELAHVSSLFVLFMALPSFVALCKWLGARRGVLVLLALAVYAVVVEFIAVKTGVPYGEFQHFDKIGYRVFDTVPWTVPFAWSPLVLASYALATRWARRENTLRVLLLSALLLVAIDLLLDPGAVAQKFWLYTRDGVLGFAPLSWRFYDVPLSNFLGWLVSGFGASWILWRALPDEARHVVAPRTLLQSSFLILCFWTSATFWMNLWLPCLVGCLLIAVFFRELFAEKSSSHELSSK
jgi:putative membrane protein